MRGDPDPELEVGPPILRDYAALWRSRAPWAARPKDTAGQVTKVVGRLLDPAGVYGGLKTSGDFVRSQALGWRPMGGRFVELEHKATIAGGIDTLAAIGKHPWVSAATAVSRLPPLTLNDDNGVKLLGIVQAVARQLGKAQPTGLAAAADFVTQAVIDERLERAAWVARMFRMLPAGIRAQKMRGAVESSVSAGLSVTAMALNGTGVGAIIGIPLQAVGLGFSAASARTKAERSRAESLLDRLSVEFDFELASRANEQQLQAIKQSLTAGARGDVSSTQVQLEAQRIQNLTKAGVTVGVTSVIVLVAYALTRRST